MTKGLGAGGSLRSRHYWRWIRVTFAGTGFGHDGQERAAVVWGFLKYHHPAVTSGQHHWDYELFRIMPQVLAAPDQASALAAISKWIANFGPVAPCTDCATLALNTNLGWLSDTSLLGADLSQTLQSIYANRTPQSTQFYISLVSGVGNPSFKNELTYSSIKFPDSGYQLLALFRFWNMVQYFYPNREIMANDPASRPNYWDQVLAQFIPTVAEANSSFAYQRQMMQFIAKINDTHANLWSSTAVRPPTGSCYLPADLQFVQGVPVVLRNTSKSASPVSGLLPGDVIQQLGAADIGDLVTQWTPFYADSNQAARLRDMAEYMTRGACGQASHRGHTCGARRGARTSGAGDPRTASPTPVTRAGAC